MTDKERPLLSPGRPTAKDGPLGGQQTEGAAWGSYVALGSTVLCVTISQVLLKFAGQHALGQESGLMGVAKNPWLWASLFFSGVGLLYWLKTLRHLPLSSAYPWTALIYVLTPLASALLFHDPLGLKYTAGMVFIVAGVYLTATSQSRP